MDGSVTRQNVCQPDAPSVCAACSWSVADLAQDGNHLAHDERQRDEHRREDHPGQREDHLDPLLGQPVAEPAGLSVDEDQRQPDDHRGDRERQVDEAFSSQLPRELVAHDQQGAGDAEDRVQRDRDRTITIVSQKACSASGVVTASQAASKPFSKVR